jgi:hypothetical protein
LFYWLKQFSLDGELMMMEIIHPHIIHAVIVGRIIQHHMKKIIHELDCPVLVAKDVMTGRKK